MLKALLHGKLSREQENMEDILTSNVFGLLEYLPPEDGLLPFLGMAQTKDGCRPLAGLVDPVTARTTYWPWWENEGCAGCEPDCVIDLRAADGRRQLVAVEAKFLSGKSSEADEKEPVPVDQLAREWDNLVAASAHKGAEPVLIYLTAHAGFPGRDIEAPVAEYRRKRSGSSDPVICWLSWRHLADIAKGQLHPVLADLAAMLRRLGLHFYRGTGTVKSLPPGAWVFRQPEAVFSWVSLGSAQTIHWEFVQ